MSGEDTFITRWSRLKRSAAQGKVPESEQKARDRLTTDEGGARVARVPEEGPRRREETEPPFDPASLPPIESIVADTDVRSFLQKGVPAALTKAALRRAWTSDPAIRDFIEVAENQWDFTDPTAIPGFGPLRASESLRRLVGQTMGKLQEPADPVEPLNQGRDSVAGAAKDACPDLRSQGMPPQEQQCNQDTADVAALQHPEPAPGVGSVPRRKGHGGAMPK
jgi:hypothetical protein